MLFLSLLACYDFAGDEGVLGFASDLLLQHRVAWTPEHPVVGGCAPTFGVGAVLDEEGTPLQIDEGEGETWLEGSSEFPFASDDDGLVQVFGPRRGNGEVLFEGELPDGEPLSDHFQLRFRPADEVFLADAAGEPLDEIALVPGSEVALAVQVRDRWSRPLGYRAEDLVVETDGALQAWVDDSEVVLTGGEGGLFLDLVDGEGFVAVSHGQVAERERVVVHETDEALVVQERAWTAEGVRVFGFSAEWEEGLEVLAPDLALQPR